mmetsp:Transcript_15384/g.30878  ORF Transcript_15384/g.30878 Transcript_15384/m.30878 type:complete len:262 (-) Transcript_15384:30-815(-)
MLRHLVESMSTSESATLPGAARVAASTSAASCRSLTRFSNFHPGCSAFLHLSSWWEHSCAMPSHLHPSGAYLHCTMRCGHSITTCLARPPRVSFAVQPTCGHAVGNRASVCSASTLRMGFAGSSVTRQLGQVGLSSAAMREWQSRQRMWPEMHCSTSFSGNERQMLQQRCGSESSVGKLVMAVLVVAVALEEATLEAAALEVLEGEAETATAVAALAVAATGDASDSAGGSPCEVFFFLAGFCCLSSMFVGDHDVPPKATT